MLSGGPTHGGLSARDVQAVREIGCRLVLVTRVGPSAELSALFDEVIVLEPERPNDAAARAESSLARSPRGSTGSSLASALRAARPVIGKNRLASRTYRAVMGGRVRSLGPQIRAHPKARLAVREADLLVALDQTGTRTAWYHARRHRRGAVLGLSAAAWWLRSRGLGHGCRDGSAARDASR